VSQEQEKSGPIPIRKKPNFYGLNIDKRAIPGVQNVIVVASGKGGVGKSTVSTNLAVALGKLGKRVGLLDADIYGPSAPMMLGLTGTLHLSDDNKLIPKEAHGIKTMSFGFLSDHYHPVIWRGPMISKALQQLFYDVAWGELDYLVVDLPPGTGDIQLTLIERLPIHGALIVTTPQDIALLDAHKALSMFTKLEVNVLGVVENMSQFACPHCGGDVDIFGHEGVNRFSEERKLPVLCRIPLNKTIRMNCDAGTPAAMREGPEGTFKLLAEVIQGKIETVSFV
jgi:ATP-binding protein involved in chromosome partitioning